MSGRSTVKIEENSNANRFIATYNRIDHSLRAQYNLKRGQAFSDVIRRCSSLNSIVRKFEDDLVDYGRLRNAIIHGNSDEYIIAEPHLEVVEHFEKIADLICTPPLAINSVCRRDVLSVKSDVSVKNVIELIYTSGYSNIPVYKDGSLIGIANGSKLLNVLGEQVSRKISIDKFMQETLIGDVIHTQSSENYYTVVSAKVTIEEALNLFYNNRKLLVILITKTGNFMEPALGIITVTDIMDLNSVLDNFD